MNRKMMGRVALVSLTLGVSTIACTPGDRATHVGAISDQTAKARQTASRAAAQARVAMVHRQSGLAVESAETAVAAAPGDAAYRVLLGQAYMGAGRFASAEAAFRDSLTLSPDQPKVEFRLALAQIAEGRATDAQALLKALDGQVPAADLGLALAMAGDRASGIAKLVDLVRSGQSDARGRQNLALAFALDGRWRECRAVAMQDTPPDRIEERIASWAVLAQPQAGGLAQVAAMLGVKPVGDPGMPTMLALAVPSPIDAPVALAAASPFAPTPGAAQIPAFQLAALSLSTIAPSVTVPLDAPAAITATPADAPASAVMLAAQTDAAAARPAAPATPLLLRVSTPAAPPFLLRAPRSALRKALLTIQPQTALRRSGYVVQLGAFRRAGAIQAAWARAAKLMPRLASFSPVHAEFSASGGALVRLSVGGFETRDDATRLCTQIHARGGQCFVREIAGDAPVQWVRSETGQRAG